MLDAFFGDWTFAERCSFVLSSGPRCRHHYMTRINVARGHGDGVVAGALGQRAREREDDVGHEHAGEARRLRSRHLWHKRGIGHWALGIGHWALGIGHWVCLEPTRTVVGIGEGVRRPVRGDGDSRLRRAKYGGGGGEEPQRQARHRGYRHPLEPTLSAVGSSVVVHEAHHQMKKSLKFKKGLFSWRSFIPTPRHRVLG